MEALVEGSELTEEIAAEIDRRATERAMEDLEEEEPHCGLLPSKALSGS